MHELAAGAEHGPSDLDGALLGNGVVCNVDGAVSDGRDFLDDPLGRECAVDYVRSPEGRQQVPMARRGGRDDWAEAG